MIKVVIMTALAVGWLMYMVGHDSAKNKKRAKR